MRTILERLAAGAARWEVLQQRPAYRLGGVGLGLAFLAIILLSDPPAGLSRIGWRTLGVTGLMAAWWLGGVLPITVTALVPLIAFPLLGVATIKETAVPYANPLVFLMLGGFVIGRAMESVGLHERIVAGLLRSDAARRSPRWRLLALMVATGVLSGLVSNTATTVMLLPLALTLAPTHVANPARVRSAFALGLAYSASIGGVSTLVGTLPNAVFAGVLLETTGREVGFADWLFVGVPFSMVAVPVAWWVVTRLLVPDTRGELAEAPDTPPWRPGEPAVVAVIAMATAAWLFRKPLDLGGGFVIPGWSASTGLEGLVDDAWVAVFAAVALFLVPMRREGRPSFVMDFADVERNIPWSVLFLLGGGFALSAQVKASGLTDWLAQGTDGLAALPPVVAVGLICLGVTFLTELTSNTATTQILLPLLAAGATRAGADPVIWMLPATISASCAFMMPVATPPNAIAAQGAGVSPGDMATAGFVLNVVLAGWATVIAFTLARWAL
ncbi:MAG: DASS family sodium-coupled anion symporter [Myxococcota bacterium]